MEENNQIEEDSEVGSEDARIEGVAFESHMAQIASQKGSGFHQLMRRDCLFMNNQSFENSVSPRDIIDREYDGHPLSYGDGSPVELDQGDALYMIGALG